MADKAQQKPFYCLRCQHRFPALYVPMQAMERSCPKCGSNSVRGETAASAARHAEGDSREV